MLLNYLQGLNLESNGSSSNNNNEGESNNNKIFNLRSSNYYRLGGFCGYCSIDSHLCCIGDFCQKGKILSVLNFVALICICKVPESWQDRFTCLNEINQAKRY